MNIDHVIFILMITIIPQVKAEFLKIGVVTGQPSKSKQVAADENGWALYAYNGQLRHASNGNGTNFLSKYSNNTIIRVELDLDASPPTLSFTHPGDIKGEREVKKAFDLPAGKKYYPALGVQSSGTADVRSI